MKDEFEKLNVMQQSLVKKFRILGWTMNIEGQNGFLRFKSLRMARSSYVLCSDFNEATLMSTEAEIVANEFLSKNSIMIKNSLHVFLMNNQYIKPENVGCKFISFMKESKEVEFKGQDARKLDVEL